MDKLFVHKLGPGVVGYSGLRKSSVHSAWFCSFLLIVQPDDAEISMTSFHVSTTINNNFGESRNGMLTLENLSKRRLDDVIICLTIRNPIIRFI